MKLKPAVLLPFTLVLAACSNPGSTPASQAVTWTVQPVYPFEEIQPMIAWFGEFHLAELEGYATAWSDNDERNSCDMCGIYNAPAKRKYTDDVIAYKINGKYGFIGYDGEVLMPALFAEEKDRFNPQGASPVNYIYDGVFGVKTDWEYNEDYSENYVIFSPDFKEYEPYRVPTGYDDGWWDPTVIYDGQLGNYSESGYTTCAGFHMENGQMIYDDCEEVGAGFHAYGDNWTEQRAVAAPIIDEAGNVTGAGVIRDGQLTATDMYCYRNSGIQFVNGYLKVTDTNTGRYYAYNGEDPVRLTYLNTHTGEVISPCVYEDGLWFEDGFVPVKKDGKWGYLNEAGEEVTEFIFDDASPVYDGRVWVKLDGLYGVLNLRDTLSAGVPITYDTCKAGIDPEAEVPDLDTGIQINESREEIGFLNVKVDNLNVRSAPDTGASVQGTANSGYQYDVYEVRREGGYTWYCVHADREHWLADQDGTWVDYTPFE